MTDPQKLRARLIALRTGLLGVAALSQDAAVEASALRSLCDDALADLVALELQVAHPRRSALALDGENGMAGLLVAPSPDDKIH